MYDYAIVAKKLGKMYMLYQNSIDKILDVFGISKLLFWQKPKYREFWALRDIDLSIKKGEKVGIIGRNGAGKSTLLKIITGNISPTEGSVMVNGKIQALMELGTGFHPEFTGRQNIRAALAYQGLSEKKIAKLEEEIVDFAELEDFIDQPVRTYSAGMYTRLAFSVATAVEPEILIIDEILGAGDAYFTGKCLERMRRLTDDYGATVLFVSHDLASVQMLCERVIWIDRGRIRADGKALDVLKLFSAEVRKDEELRLKARDLRIQKRSAKAINSLNDIFDSFMFHLVTDTPHPLEKHLISEIALYCQNECIGKISVGDAMDNSIEYPHYIIDDRGYMDWGPPQQKDGVLCRAYKNCGGVYNHAPFHFSVLRSLTAQNSNFTLVIKHLLNQKEKVYVELFWKDNYKRLGRLVQKSNSFDCTAVDFNLYEYDITSRNEMEVKMPENQSDLVSYYGSMEMKITCFETLDSEGNPSKIFTSEGTLIGRFHYYAEDRIENPVFVLCIYRPDGTCVTQVIKEAKDIGMDYCEGAGIVDVVFEPLLLGRGSYVVSAGIFKYVNLMDTSESPAYCVMDRNIHFQVYQKDGIAKDLGMIIHPVKWRIAVMDN